VLANMAAMGSDKFASERLPGGKVVGKFDMSKVNTRGGSLALGHPFGATGTHRMRVGKSAPFLCVCISVTLSFHTWLALKGFTVVLSMPLNSNCCSHMNVRRQHMREPVC
jgi:hypothetical protein